MRASNDHLMGAGVTILLTMNHVDIWHISERDVVEGWFFFVKFTKILIFGSLFGQNHLDHDFGWINQLSDLRYFEILEDNMDPKPFG